MPTVMNMRWSGVTPEEYDEAREVVNWEGDVPDGARFHIAWFEDGGLRVVDPWDSPENFQAFVENRLNPGVQQVGIEGEPEVTMTESHAVFAPAYE
jgi:hypothetical protein